MQKVRDAVDARGVMAVARETGATYHTLRSYLDGGEIRSATRARLLRWAEGQGAPDAAAALVELGGVEAPRYDDPPRYRSDYMPQKVEAGRLPLWGSGA